MARFVRTGPLLPTLGDVLTRTTIEDSIRIIPGTVLAPNERVPMTGPERPQRAVKCQLCTRLATGRVRASGATQWPALNIPHCDECWDAVYDKVHRYPARTWTTIEQPEPDVLF